MRYMDQQMLYWIMDANDMRYVDHTHTCMHACAVKFLIELPSVGLTLLAQLVTRFYV